MKTSGKYDLNKIYRDAKKGDKLACQILCNTCEKLITKKFATTFKEISKEDVLQKLFLRIFTTEKFNSKKSSFSSWFLMIANSAFIDEYRALRRKESKFKTYFYKQSYFQNKKKHTIDKEKIDFVLNCIQELESVSAEIICLQFIHGRTQVEISNILKIPLGTVKSKSNRAIKLLRILTEKSNEKNQF